VNAESRKEMTKTTSVKLPLDLDSRLMQALQDFEGDKSKFIRQSIEEFLDLLDEIKILKTGRAIRRAAEEVGKEEAAERLAAPDIKKLQAKISSAKKKGVGGEESSAEGGLKRASPEPKKQR
jgi:predicted DNA-binding protein